MAAPQALPGDPSDFTFLYPGMGVGGGPRRWNPCQTVTVAGGPPLTGAILAELTNITGLKLVEVAGPADIQISGGNLPPEIMGATTNSWATWFTHATVVWSIDRADHLPTVLRHELGHALGLGHSQGAEEIMSASSHARDYGAGDVNGLRQVGSGAGTCSSSRL